MRKIINNFKLNSAKCKICNTILIVEDAGEDVLTTCPCKSLKIGGGTTTLERFSVENDSYEELSTFNNGQRVPSSFQRLFSLPITALDDMVPGKWFVQKVRHYLRSKEYVNSKQDDIIIRSDDHYYERAIFRFRFGSACSYDIGYATIPPRSHEFAFHKYILKKIITPFIKMGHKDQSREFQDRTGMDGTNWE